MVTIDLVKSSAIDSPEAALLTLGPDAGEPQLIEAATGPGPLAVRFEKFNDGRGLSIAQLLRAWHGFRGEIRATGHIIPDLLPHLLRSGFDTAEVPNPGALETWRRAHNFSAAYQSAWRDPARVRSKAAESNAKALDERLSRLERLEDRILEVDRVVGDRIAFSTSLSIEDQAILHSITEWGVNVDVFTLDTGRLFPETLETLDRSEKRYGVSIRTVTPHAYEVEELVVRDGVYGFREALEKRKACCEIRKVKPLNRALKGAGAWITGLRQGQAGARGNVSFASWDPARALIKVNPIADWSLERLEAYVKANNIPTNPLHAQGFPSIGCQPCTRAISFGEDIRAGRWWWENKDQKECGLHLAGESGRAA